MGVGLLCQCGEHIEKHEETLTKDKSRNPFSKVKMELTQIFPVDQLTSPFNPRPL